MHKKDIFVIAQNCKRLTVASVVFLPRNPCSSYSGAYNTGQYTSTYYNADYFRQSTRATLSQHHYAPCYPLRTPIVCQSRQTRPRCLPADPCPGGIKDFVSAVLLNSGLQLMWPFGYCWWIFGSANAQIRPTDQQTTHFT